MPDRRLCHFGPTRLPARRGRDRWDDADAPDGKGNGRSAEFDSYLQSLVRRDALREGVAHPAPSKYLWPVLANPGLPANYSLLRFDATISIAPWNKSARI